MVLILLISSILVARGTSAAHLPSPDEIAKQASAHYGEAHAQVYNAVSTVADPPPHDPLFLLTLTGRFKNGALKPDTLSSQP
jgi:hypothetical protein